MNKPNLVLIVDDDNADKTLIKLAIDKFNFAGKIKFTSSAEELLEYFSSKETNLYDVIILLDLNMPGKGGKYAIEQMKTNENLKHIPIVVLTTSNNPEDMSQVYKNGANSYFVKPRTFTELKELIGVILKYWFEYAQISEK